MRRALLGVLLGALIAVPAAEAKRVRTFAVGPKLDLAWLDTRAHFHDHLVQLTDARVAPHLLGPTDPAQPAETARDLVALPEDLGLMAIFTDSRGRQARTARSVVEAIVAVLGSYAPQLGYYTAKYPELANRGVPTRLLALSATDTFGRVAVETYAEIAAKNHVWLTAGVNMAQSWKVVCASRIAYQPPPGGAACEEENAAKVAALRSPDEPARTYAYEATSDKASNMALLFDPEGRLVSKQVKTYLTPIELPGQLDLVPGEVFTGLSAVETPVGTLGFATSKDAWMPDVAARLDEEHVDLLIQPEFFVGDTIAAKGPWAPDTIFGAGFSDVMRHPSLQALVLPQLTGRVFDLVADAQQAIMVKPRSAGAAAGHLAGQRGTPGLVAVGGYSVAEGAGSVPQRRKRVSTAAGKLGDRRGVESVIFRDVDVDVTRAVSRRPREKRARTAFSVNRPLAPSRYPQRNAKLATLGSTVVAAYEEQRGSTDVVLVTVSKDRGRTWSAPVSPTGVTGHAWWPAVAIGPTGTVWLAWSDARSGTQRVYVARSADGVTFGAPIPVDAGPGPAVSQMRPAITATGADTAFVAFADDRARFTADDLPQAGIWGVRMAGDAPAPAVRLDVGAPVALARTLDHAWAPSVAARGAKVVAAWTDFANYEWNVTTRTSNDGGATWGAEAPATRPRRDDEHLDDTPSAATASGGRAMVAFAGWSKAASSVRRESPLYGIEAVVPGRRTVAHVDGRLPFRNAFAPSLTVSDGRFVVAWQDHRGGPGDIYASVYQGGRWRAAKRVDDSGRAGWNQWRPAAAGFANDVIVAWEDERDGPAQIFFATARTRSLWK